MPPAPPRRTPLLYAPSQSGMNGLIKTDQLRPNSIFFGPVYRQIEI